MKEGQKPHIGMLLKAHRRGLRPKHSQEYVAEEAGMSTVHLQKIEQGRATPSLPTLLEVGRVMGIDEAGMREMIEASTYSTDSMKQRTLWMTRDEDRRLRNLAGKLGVTDRELMRRFIQEGLDRANRI